MIDEAIDSSAIFWCHSGRLRARFKDLFQDVLSRDWRSLASEKFHHV